ncbi:hypothetical protein KIH27_15970 [Mycobacterium sp. M1]|uniref:Uncharacterized protein n=1 Tax=Mycolicibacter acidiphilus TaxID=2835306 RepID=A0ABS5RLC6_9MYCO|nr:hypothetical protein [Mycolicibacter acidiphilus]MBS9535085.1 hypothetical protein [Mycolicibacter acidiphilus]
MSTPKRARRARPPRLPKHESPKSPFQLGPDQNEDLMHGLNPALAVEATVVAVHAANGDDTLESLTLAILRGSTESVVADLLDDLGYDAEHRETVRLLKTYGDLRTADSAVHDRSAAWLSALTQGGVL